MKGTPYKRVMQGSAVYLKCCLAAKLIVNCYPGICKYVGIDGISKGELPYQGIQASKLWFENLPDFLKILIMEKVLQINVLASCG